jgi:hypothetical protein
MDGYRSATITPEEAAVLMRDVGIKMDSQTLRAGIEQGRLPFGVYIEMNRRFFLVSKKKLAEWIEDFAGVKVSFDVDGSGEVVRS